MRPLSSFTQNPHLDVLITGELNRAAHFFVIGAFLLIYERAGLAPEPLQLRAPVTVFVGLVTAVAGYCLTLAGAILDHIPFN